MLRLEAMRCGYGPICAVSSLDLQVEPAQVFALIGANGAGKSSTIMAIAGHVELQGGKIIFDGQDLAGVPARQRVRAGIGLVPEGRRLFSDLSVDENLIVGGYCRDAKRTPKNRDKVLALFPRLKERLGQTAGSLSGGEQQMLAMGRALMTEPRLLMIDEVSLGLMPKMVDVCYGVIRQLKDQGITIVLVEQNTQRALDVADRVCVLESGRQVWQGTADEARADPALVEAYLGLAQGDGASAAPETPSRQ